MKQIVRAVFLDRDGVLMKDVHHARHETQVSLLPTVVEGVRLLNRSGVRVLVVTNQSGIGRGYFDQAALDAIHLRLRQLLDKGGARLDEIYYCPHHPEEGCGCRKPKPGLLYQAAQQWGIHIPSSFVVGDQAKDIALARNAGCRAILVSNQQHAHSTELKPDFVAPNLYTAAQWILSRLADGWHP